MRSKYELNLEDIRAIERLTEKGVSDVNITKQLQIKRHVVQRFTTKFWKNKMKRKK